MEVVFVFLFGDLDVYVLEIGYDVYGEDDCVEYGEFVEDVGGLFLLFVYVDVNLCKVVFMRMG